MEAILGARQLGAHLAHLETPAHGREDPTRDQRELEHVGRAFAHRRDGVRVDVQQHDVRGVRTVPEALQRREPRPAGKACVEQCDVERPPGDAFRSGLEVPHGLHGRTLALEDAPHVGDESFVAAGDEHTRKTREVQVLHDPFSGHSLSSIAATRVPAPVDSPTITLPCGVSAPDPVDLLGGFAAGPERAMRKPTSRARAPLRPAGAIRIEPPCRHRSAPSFSPRRRSPRPCRPRPDDPTRRVTRRRPSTPSSRTRT